MNPGGRVDEGSRVNASERANAGDRVDGVARPTVTPRARAGVWRRLCAAACFASVLGACGGGDSNAADNTAPTPAPTPTPSPSPAPGGTVTAATSCAIPDFAAQMLNAVNAARAQARSCGGTAYAAAGALTWNDALFAAAAAHTQDMATQHALSHTGSNGSSLADRIDSTGYAWSYLGENIAAGYGGVDAVLQGWLGSTGHCANLMSPNFTEIAVACVQAGGSDPYGKYWTMDLARPR